MKKSLHAFGMCHSMFCAIPSPYQGWDEEARGRMLLFLPILGLEIGLLWAGISWVLGFFRVPQLLNALILSIYPFLVTGFLHLDGFMDVTDATLSCRDPEKRRKILKDPHVGSFAVIGCILLAVSQLVLFYEGEIRGWILLFIPGVSRCCSALAVTVLPAMETSQYAGKKKNAAHVWILALELLGMLAGAWLLCGMEALALAGLILGYLASLFHGYRSLGGMNGDISGYALTIGELCAGAVLVFM